MKTLNLKKALSFFAVGILFSFTASANDNISSSESKYSDTNKEIKEHVKFPNVFFAMEDNKQTEKINVVFTVNELGRVNLVIANTNNKQLKQLIEKQFSLLTLKQLKANNAYSIQFNFKTI